MATSTDEKEHPMVWKFSCNPKTREYTLTVEYCSKLRPAQHEELHGKMRDKVFALLERQGIDPNLVKIKFKGRVNEDGHEFVDSWEEPLVDRREQHGAEEQ